MHKVLVGLAALLLVVHGLIHLMGTTVYMKMGLIQGLPYKTTLLGSHWEVGENGMRLFGALWVLPALGFVLSAIALISDSALFQPLLVATALLSLLLTLLDWSTGYAGAIVTP